LDYYHEQALKIVGPHGWDHELSVVQLDGLAASELAGRDRSRTNAKAAAPATSTSVSSETGTNVQEAGVDEPDVVKTDGELLVRIQDATITTYDLTGEATEELSQITLEDFGDGEILLSDDTVVALGSDDARSPQG